MVKKRIVQDNSDLDSLKMRDFIVHDAPIAPSSTRKISSKIVAPTTPKF